MTVNTRRDNPTFADAAGLLHPNALTCRESSVVRKALRIIESKRLKVSEVLGCFEDFQQYLRLRFAGLVHEQGHVIYLDPKLRFIEADTLAFGGHSSVNWDIRHIAYRAMSLGAGSVALAHNHPSEDPKPSNADVENLSAFERGLSTIGIDLLDSFVVTAHQVTSIKNYRAGREEEKNRRWREEDDRIRAERKARRDANKAAKLTAQTVG